MYVPYAALCYVPRWVISFRYVAINVDYELLIKTAKNATNKRTAPGDSMLEAEDDGIIGWVMKAPRQSSRPTISVAIHFSSVLCGLETRRLICKERGCLMCFIFTETMLVAFPKPRNTDCLLSDYWKGSCKRWIPPVCLAEQLGRLSCSDCRNTTEMWAIANSDSSLCYL